MFSQIPIFLKPFIEIFLGFLYLCIFNKLYKNFINNIFYTMKESEASDQYSLLKMINYLLLFLIGAIFLLLNVTNNSYILLFVEIIIFFLLFFYSRDSLKLMDSFIYLLFRPKELKESECLYFVGSIERTLKKVTFTHIFANINIDIDINIENQDSNNNKIINKYSFIKN